MSEINLFNRWTVKKKYFWLGVGLIPVLCIVTFFVMAAFSNRSYGMAYDMVEMEAPSVGFGGGYNDSFANYDEDMSVEGIAEKSTGEMSYAVQDTATASVNNNAVASSRLIIREGNISIYAEKTRQTRDDIEAMVYSFSEEGGYVINASESSRGEGKEPYISMADPSTG